MSKGKATITMALIFLVCIALIIFGLHLAFSEDLTILGSVLTLCGGIPIWLFIQARKSSSVEAVVNNVDCSYNDKTKTLTITDKNPEYRKILSVRPHNVKSYQYVKPSYVYTGATVGGVTTGGVHKQGDYYKQSDYNTNCELVYLPTGGVIEHITIPEKLRNDARSSNITSYMKGTTIRVVDEVKPSQEFSNYMAMGLTDLGLSQQERDKAAAYPTKQKCERIINWLCQN